MRRPFYCHRIIGDTRILLCCGDNQQVHLFNFILEYKKRMIITQNMYLSRGSRNLVMQSEEKKVHRVLGS